MVILGAVVYPDPLLSNKISVITPPTLVTDSIVAPDPTVSVTPNKILEAPPPPNTESLIINV